MRPKNPKNSKIDEILSADRERLSLLIDMEKPSMVFREVLRILRSLSSELDINALKQIFNDIRNLYNGRYPGYMKCNALYHNLHHTMDITLAFTRLAHGAVVSGKALSPHNILLGVISALFHDVGYIQSKTEAGGTGAKFTATHVERSVDFLQSYFKSRKFSKNDAQACGDIIMCTSFAANIHGIEFRHGEVRLAGHLLGTADLIGQMADRLYLEKILLLYYEFREATFGDYESEFDLLRKTSFFYQLAEARIKGALGGSDRYMKYHFRERWGREEDLYADAIRRNMKYLKVILRKGDKYREALKRGNVIHKLNRLGLSPDSGSGVV